MEYCNNSFQFTYSAAQNEEVKKIRKKYLPKEESKMDQLRRLDESSTKKGLAYPLNNHLTKKERERLAPEILKLSAELMNWQA